ncbi:MAG: transglycosylase domain-containing protein [Enterocloster sp.]
MNYGTHEAERRLKSLNSKSAKYASKMFLSIFKAFFVLFLFLAIVGASIGFGMIKGIIDNAPSVDILNIQPDRFATTVYDCKGNLTDTLVTSGSNRESAAFEELPENLINAFVAIEDSRFWSHNGIDLRSIARAVKGVISDDYAGGGSTITQQLIKNNVFSGGMESGFGAKLERKLQEQYLAVQLEKNSGLSKEDTKKLIITNYLNTINLGKNTLGVKVAARRYFDKEVSDLTLSECAVLASITKNPSKLNPISGPEENAARRKIVLQYMYEQGYIKKEEQEEALADNVYDRIQNVDSAIKENNTPYSYFTDELTEQVIEALMEKLDYTENQASNLLYSGGLQIYTTQDPQIQAIVDEEVNNPNNYSAAKYSVEYRLSVTHADGTTTHYSEENLKSYRKTVLGDSSFEGLYTSEEAVQADIDRYKSWLLKDGDTIIGERQNLELQPQTSFVIMDQHTGEVKALCGGRGTKKASLTLNRASNVYRQPGSAFKVITAFAPALDTCGATLGTVYYDGPYTIGTKSFRNWWNSGYGFTGYSSIRDGIIYSMNIVAVRCLMETVTPQLAMEYAQNMGITSLTEKDLVPAMALGGINKGVSNLELTAAYASIANGGVYIKPRFFTRILDHSGKVLIDNEPEKKQVLKDSTAFLLTDAMSESMKSNRKYTRSGVSINSTSTRAALTGMSAAGKSGTTTANNDIWFVGFTPYYTAGIWGGCDNNQKLTSSNGGTSFHKDIWRNIMNRIHEGMSDPGFTIPDSIETAEICRKSGKRAVSGVCNADPRGSAVYTEYFAKGTVPAEVCDKHVAVTVCEESGQRPTEFCPNRTSRVCMVLPDGEDEITDDSMFAIPGYCSIHTDSSTILSPSGETGDGNGSYVTPIGPGYQTISPISPVTPTIEGPGPGD